MLLSLFNKYLERKKVIVKMFPVDDYGELVEPPIHIRLISCKKEINGVHPTQIICEHEKTGRITLYRSGAHRWVRVFRDPFTKVVSVSEKEPMYSIPEFSPGGLD